MAQPSIIVYSATDVENIPMLGDSNVFTGTNEFDGTTNFDGAVDFDGTLTFSTRTETATYTVAAGDYVINCNKTSAMTVNLPAASGSGRILVIKNINTGVVTVDGNSGDTIDGETTQALNQWDSMTVIDYVVGGWVII